MGGFFLYELLPIVLNMSVTASAVILAVLLARMLLKSAPKVFSYVLWAVVLFRLLCPVSVATSVSLLGLLDAPASMTTAHMTSVEYLPRSEVRVPAAEDAPAAQSGPRDESAPAQSGGRTAAERLTALSSLVWLAGIAGLAAYSAASLLRLRRRLAEAVPLRENIYLSDRIDSPFVMGVFRPKIYLPAALSEGEQHYILLHERYHIRRLDHIVKALAFSALCIHWFNPLVWVSFVLSSRDMEMSCDEAVLKTLGADIRADYSASLLSLATGRRILAGMPLAFGEGDTGSRIRNLLRWKKPSARLTAAAAVVCAAVTAACAGNPWEAAETTPVVLLERFASMEEYARYIMDETKTACYYRVSDGNTATANVTDTKLVRLEKRGEVAGLAPDGVLEAWSFQYLVRVDADPAEIMLVGGMYEEDGWYELEGQGGRDLVALRGTDGVYRVLYNNVVNDGLDFYGCHNSYEEAVYDWYVTENGLDLPLYVRDLTAGDGTVPARRYDGDGWYLYLPVSGWEQVRMTGDNADNTWGWRSANDTGAYLTVDHADAQAAASLRGHDSGWKTLDSEGHVWEQRGEDYARWYFTDLPDGGCWRVSVLLPAGSAGVPEELETLYAAAESFTVVSPAGAGKTEPPDGKTAEIDASASAALTREELDWFDAYLTPLLLDKQGNAMGANVRCCFLTSYYDDVRDMDFEEFLRYFPGDGTQTSGAEFEALRQADGWPFGEVASLEEMLVPVHRYPRRLVDLCLGEYAGISTADLNTERAAYLAEYDAYYNYTSDFGLGQFLCTRGERDGELIYLYDENFGVKRLTLRQTGENAYQFVSHQLLKA